MPDITAAYSQALIDLAEQNPNVVVLDADVADSCQTDAFAKKFPQRSFDLGVAEQSLPTFSAGLALCGKIPFYNCFAPFAVARSFDMIRQTLCYMRANVKIAGHCAGQSMGYTGPTHHTIEDIGALRTLPNMVILNPCDAEEAKQMTFAAAAHNGPVYLRLVRMDVPAVHGPDYKFRIGKADLLRPGRDISLFVTGDLAAKCLSLADSIQKRHGVGVQVVNVPTLKPLAPQEIVQYGEQTRAAITVEDHNVIGGLGSLVCEIYAENLRKPVKRIGILDRFTESAPCEDLREKHGLSDAIIVNAIVELASVKC